MENDARDDVEEKEEVITVEMIDDNVEKTTETVSDASPDSDTVPLSSSSSSDHKQTLSGGGRPSRGSSDTKLFLRRLVGVRAAAMDEVSQEARPK